MKREIRPVLPPPEIRKMTFKLPVPTINDFETYLIAFFEIYGVEADRDLVDSQIFSAFFESDRGFLAYRKSLPAADAAGAEGSARFFNVKG